MTATTGARPGLLFWRPFGVSIVNSVAIQAIGVTTGVVLARVLGPSDRGALAAVLLWPAMYATLGLFGLSDAVTYRIVRDPAVARRISGAALRVVVAQSLLLVGVGAALTPLVLGHYGRHVVFWGLIAVVQIPLTLASQTWASVLNGMQRYGVFQLARFSVIALGALGILVLAPLGRLTVGSAVTVYAAANAATTLIIALVVARAGLLTMRGDWSSIRGLLSYGAKSHVGVLSSALNQRLDQLVISVILSSALLGTYVVAVAVAGTVGIVSGAITLQTIPQVGKAGTRSELRGRVASLFTVTFISSLGIAAVGVAAAGPLVRIFFGAAFAGAVTPTRILLVAGVFLGTGAVMSNVLRALGQPLQAGLGELLALGVTVAALLALVPTIGITGAAIASLLAYATSAWWMTHRAAESLELTLRDFVYSGLRLVTGALRSLRTTGASSARTAPDAAGRSGPGAPDERPGDATTPVGRISADGL